eukprot:13746369-Alexandrium_andersonii.AAC.1
MHVQRWGCGAMDASDGRTMDALMDRRWMHRRVDDTRCDGDVGNVPKQDSFMNAANVARRAVEL